MATFRQTYKARVPFAVRNAIGLQTSSLAIVCSEHKSSGVTLKKHKFLVSPSMTIGQFLVYLRKHTSCTHSHALFLFLGPQHAVPRVGDAMSDVHRMHQDEDGILYITVCGENTFGV